MSFRRVSRAAFVRAAHAGLGNGVCAACKEADWYEGAANHQHVLVVVANIYYRGRWRRRAVYHVDCYEAKGQPYGPPAERKAA